MSYSDFHISYGAFFYGGRDLSRFLTEFPDFFEIVSYCCYLLVDYQVLTYLEVIQLQALAKLFG